MARLREEDSTLVGMLQAQSVNGEDPIRALLRHTIQEVLEEEMTAFLNAEPYTRTEERRGYWNGYKPRTLMTRVGRLELMVPKDREGQFQTDAIAGVFKEWCGNSARYTLSGMFWEWHRKRIAAG